MVGIESVEGDGRMIKKEDLKDWLAESERFKAIEAIEIYIDEAIKKNALAGKMNFRVSTGRVGHGHHERTKFYKLWHAEDLSRENQKIVQKKIIEKYRDFGFEVSLISEDCGWHSRYDALEFKNINKVIQ